VRRREACSSPSTSPNRARLYSGTRASLVMKTRVEAARLALRLRSLARLAQNEERRRAGGEARSRGGLGKGAVTELERKHLAEVDRQIAECEAYIAQQRELIERAIQHGRSTEVAEETLDSLEASLRAFEKQRRWLLDRLKSESDE
jgi:hypothetical protein